MKHIIFNTHLKKNIYDINYDLSFQKLCIHNMYYDICNEPHIESELKKKNCSYKQQDKKKNKYDQVSHITYKELIQKLYDCDLKCYYCKHDLYILYKHKKSMTQWSLERLNNNIGHYSNNTCISCLRCNLQRRNDNHEYFKFSKQLNIIRMDDKSI